MIDSFVPRPTSFCGKVLYGGLRDKAHALLGAAHVLAQRDVFEAISELAERELSREEECVRLAEERASLAEAHAARLRAHLAAAKAHLTTKEELDELGEKHDALVDENYDLQVQIISLQERLKRAERSSSSAGEAGVLVGAQDGRAGA